MVFLFTDFVTSRNVSKTVRGRGTIDYSTTSQIVLKGTPFHLKACTLVLA